MKITYALQNLKHSNGSSSVFPPLIGSHRKVKTDNSSHTPPYLRKNILSPKKEQQQANFLYRMKKARDIILSHQRRKKVEADEANKLVQKLKNQGNFNFLTKDKRKSFSQVVYKIQQSHKRLPKNENIDNQKFNDRILRQCKSQFMPNMKQRYKKNHYYINKKKQFTERTKLQNSHNFFIQNPQRKQNNHSSSKTKVQSSQKYLMKALLNQQLIKSSGCQLIQKLKKCLNEKQKQNNQNSKNQNQIKKQQQQQIPEQIQQNNQNKLQFPYSQPKKQSRTQSKKYFRKEKKKIKITFKKETEQKEDDDIQMQQQQKQLQNQNQNRIKLVYQGTLQTPAKKTAEKEKIISKSTFIDLNFKIQGWNNKQSHQLQLY